MLLYMIYIKLGGVLSLKKICRYCFNFVDKSCKICPICHRRVDGKSDARVSDFGNTKQKVELKEIDNTPQIDESQIHKIKWIPKKKREGYQKEKEDKKSKSIRLEGVHLDVLSQSIFGADNKKNKYTPKPSSGILSEDDYKLEKLKWWEIYKRADRWLVRRKLNRTIKKQSCVKPARISQTLMVVLSLLTGYLGLHDFYAKNYKRGAITLGLFAWSITLVALMDIWPWLINVQYSLIAFPGLVCVMLWLWDFVAIIFKRYVYNESKLNFIYSLDVETRAWVGNKYISVPNWYEYKKDN